MEIIDIDVFKQIEDAMNVESRIIDYRPETFNLIQNMLTSYSYGHLDPNNQNNVIENTLKHLGLIREIQIPKEQKEFNVSPHNFGE